MGDCWNCNNSNPESANFCGDCGSPQTPETAANLFRSKLRDLTRGVHGVTELTGVEGNPEMTAQGLADQPDLNISRETWEDRFKPTPITWLDDLVFRLWLNHYELTVEEFVELAEEHDLVTEKNDESSSSLDPQTFPKPDNTGCPCGAPLPSNPPEIIAKWNEGIESTAVCFNCFGEMNDRLEVSR